MVKIYFTFLFHKSMFLKSQKNYCMLYLLELVSEIKTINLEGPKPGGLSLVSFSILTNYDMKRGVGTHRQHCTIWHHW